MFPSCPERRYYITQANKKLVGAAAGAAICAVTRFAVAIAFIWYVSHWGGKWWSGGSGLLWAAFISALIGIPVGGFAGWTCKPKQGAVIGAALSGGSCCGLFVLPTNAMIALSHHSGSDGNESFEILAAFVAMTLVGGIGGGAGAAMGKRAGNSDKLR